MDCVQIADVTLREHGQNVRPKELDRFSVDLRVGTARALIRAGVRRLELVSCVSPRVAPAMAEPLVKKVAHGVGRPEDVTIVTLVPNRQGFELFQRAGLGADGLGHTVGLFFSAVEEHNRANLGRSIADSLDECERLAKAAAASGTQVAAYVSAAFGYRPDPASRVTSVDLDTLVGFVRRMFDLGAITVTLSDLQGVADPEQTATVLTALLDRLPREVRTAVGYHAHHSRPDGGIRLAGAAARTGIRLFDGSLGAVGGCVTGAPGNAPTEGLLALFEDMGLEAGVDRAALERIAEDFNAAALR